MHLFYWAIALLSSQSIANSDALRINEILYAPESSDLEFIELLNISDNSVNLCTYTFSDNREQEEAICEGKIELHPAEFAVLSKDGQALMNVFPGVTPITPDTWPALNNSGDTVQLFREGKVVEAVPYLSSWGVRGRSLERIDPAGPSNYSFNWGPSAAPAGATPGETNSIFAPDQTPPSPLLAEVQKNDHLFLVLDEIIDTTQLQPANFRIAQSEASSLDILTDSTVILHFPQGIRGNQLLIRNIADLSNNQSGVVSIPLSFIPEENDLLITEIMYEPRNNAFDNLFNQPEYIELYNDSGTHLSLRTLQLNGKQDEMGNREVLIPKLRYETLPPFSYTVLVASATRESAQLQLQNAFPSISTLTSTLSVLNIPRSSLGLTNSGDYVCVSSSSVECITELTYSPSMHHPGLASTRGISLERRSLSASTLESTNWSSSVDSHGGTPGWQNSIFIALQHKEVDQIVQLIPDIFSPDGDGNDDALTILIMSPFPTSTISIRIFNALGHLVHELVPMGLAGSEATYLWNGRDKHNDALPPGIYILLIEILDIIQGESLSVKKVTVLAKALD